MNASKVLSKVYRPAAHGKKLSEPNTRAYFYLYPKWPNYCLHSRLAQIKGL